MKKEYGLGSNNINDHSWKWGHIVMDERLQRLSGYCKRKSLGGALVETGELVFSRDHWVCCYKLD